jgi:hypothetical protein
LSDVSTSVSFVGGSRFRASTAGPAGATPPPIGLGGSASATHVVCDGRRWSRCTLPEMLVQVRSAAQCFAPWSSASSRCQGHRWHAEASRERAPEPPAQHRRSAHPGDVPGETSRTASGHHHGRLLAALAEHRAVDGTGRPGPMLRRRTCAAICQPARRRAPGPTARPTWSPPHPEQGWSLLCNGVVLFDDNGELLPDGRPLAPPRVETVMSGSGAPR